MHNLFKTATAASFITLYISAASAQTCAVALKTMIPVGCFSSGDPLEDQGSYTFQTAGYCQCVCATLNKPVMATSKGSDCYCGDLLPPTDTVASNSSCNSPCNGYGTADCGGEGFWSVALTGTESSVDSSDGSSGSSASSSSSSTPPPPTPSAATVTTSVAPSVITKAGQTIIVTASSSPTLTGSPISSGKSTNKTGIAVGVVVGFVLVAAVIGGIFFFLKQRKRRAVEAEYKKAAAVNQFIAGGKKSDASSTNDQRLDPSIAFHRHQSIGSIADERDFSRRILQVRNPDGV